MSADNGIYILKTKDQYRVAHIQGIDNVSWSVIDGNWQNYKSKRGKCVPTRVVEMWGKCKYTKDVDTAMNIARQWSGKLLVCEYGINIIKYNKTWKHIVEDAIQYAEKEIEYIKMYKKEKLYDMKRLQSIADGSYFEIK